MVLNQESPVSAKSVVLPSSISWISPKMRLVWMGASRLMGGSGITWVRVRLNVASEVSFRLIRGASAAKNSSMATP